MLDLDGTTSALTTTRPASSGVASRRWVAALAWALFGLCLGVGFLLVGRGTGRAMQESLAPGTCVANGAKSAEAEVVAGAPARVQTRLAISCRPVTAPLHVALVMDGSEAMSGTLKNQIQAQAAELVRALRLPANPTTKMAVIEYSDRVRRHSDLTNDEARLLTAVARTGARGKPMIELGLREALALLQAERQAAGAPAELSEVIVLLSNGRNEKGCSAAVTAAAEAKANRILVLAACVSAGCELDCLRQVATAPRYAFVMPDQKANLIDVLRRGQRQVAVTIVDLLLTEELRLPYVLDSGSPAPDWVSDDRLELRWRFGSVSAEEELTVGYSVETMTPGEQEVGVRSRAVFTNSVGWRGEFIFPQPRIRVLPPPETAEPTATEEATAPVPTPSPSEEPTAPPVLTPGPGTRLSLPWLGRSASLERNNRG